MLEYGHMLLKVYVRSVCISAMKTHPFQEFMGVTSPDHPVLYTLNIPAPNEKIRFSFVVVCQSAVLKTLF